jgi:hypothetical protein
MSDPVLAERLTEQGIAVLTFSSSLNPGEAIRRREQPQP